MTNATLERIANCDKLKVVGLTKCAIDDVGVAQLATHTKIETLFLACMGISNASVESLAKMKSLHHVSLFETHLTSQGVARLKSLNAEIAVDYLEKYPGCASASERSPFHDIPRFQIPLSAAD